MKIIREIIHKMIPKKVYCHRRILLTNQIYNKFRTVVNRLWLLSLHEGMELESY